MHRRSLLLAALAAGISEGQPIKAAQLGELKRIAVLLQDRQELWEDFHRELPAQLASLGWVEGQNLRITWRYANDEPVSLRQHVREIVALGADAIITRGTQATIALQQATSKIPIITGVGDPIGSGFAKTYAEPSGNITGLSWGIVELEENWLELLRLMVPKLALLHVVLSPNLAAQRPLEQTARSTQLALRRSVVKTSDELRAELATDHRAGEVAAVIFNLPAIKPETVARIALDGRMPTMFQERDYVEAGGLASYWLDWANQTQRTAAQVDKVLRGADPGRIPFELPQLSQFVLNRKTARAIGLELPRSLILREDEIIE